jgi:RHS repeat-associated protein
VTRTRFHQDAAKLGLPESVEQLTIVDVAGTPTEVPWATTLTTYNADATPPYVSLPTSTTLLEYDGTITPRRSRVDFAYDGYGNPIQQLAYGEVDANGADPSSADNRVLERAYAPPDLSSYIVDRVALERIRAAAPGSPSVRETTFAYDSRGRPTQRSVWTGTGPPLVTTYVYGDAYGNVTATTNPRANSMEGVAGTTKFEYDATWHTFRTAVVNPKGHRSETAYAAHASCPVAYPAGAGLVQTAKDPNDLLNVRQRILCYDVFGRPTRDTATGDLAQTEITYDDTPGAIRVTSEERASASGVRRTTVEVDGLGRTIRTTTSGPQGQDVEQTRSYGANGQLVSETAPHFVVGDPVLSTTHLYDPLGRPTSTTLPGARTVQTSYTKGTAAVTDANGNVTRRVSDVFGSVIRVEEVDGAAIYTTAYGYDVAGQLVSIRDDSGNLTSLYYDGAGRRYLLVDPDTGTTLFTFDANGNVRTRADGEGAAAWTYDVLDRPLRRTADGVEDATWLYDVGLPSANPIGALTRETSAAGGRAVQQRDALGRPTREQITLAGFADPFTVETTYDPLGQPLARKLANKNRTVSRTYDARGFLQTLSSGGTDLASGIQWDARGRLVSWTAGNGVATANAFDSATRRLERIEVRTGSGAALEKLVYGFDPGDRMTAIYDQGPAGLADRSFQYDGLDRLTAATGPYLPAFAATTLRYGYDPIGNLRCKDATSAAPTCTPGALGRSFTYPAAGAPRPHAPLSVTAGGQTLTATYTETGHLEALGPRLYGYDAHGQLTTVAEGGKTLATQRFDANGVRRAIVDRSGRRAVTRHFAATDFEWDETRGLVRTHVTLDGTTIATIVEPFAGLALAAAPPAPAPGRPLSREGVAAVVFVPAFLGAAGLALQLAALRRRGRGLARPALAGGTAIALLVGLAAPTIASAPLSGDLNDDGRLDAADALLGLQIARGQRTASPGELARGDVAPLEQAPQSPSSIDDGDVVLMLRALRGEDVDGDAVDVPTELAAGTSPFRIDTDRDFLTDAFELSFGTDPTLADTDGDGLSDAAEVTAGTDPNSADTDGDGFADASDPQPKQGVVYRHTDHLGSTTLTTRSDAQVIERAVYRPYGGVVPGTAGGSTKAPEFGFTGQRYESGLGIYDYGARFYDPALGRFLQADAVVPGGGFDPLGLNRYSYVRNSPIDRIDPTGNFSFHLTGFSAYAGVEDEFGFTGVTFGYRGGRTESHYSFGAYAGGVPVLSYSLDSTLASVHRSFSLFNYSRVDTAGVLGSGFAVTAGRSLEELRTVFGGTGPVSSLGPTGVVFGALVGGYAGYRSGGGRSGFAIGAIVGGAVGALPGGEGFASVVAVNAAKALGSTLLARSIDDTVVKHRPALTGLSAADVAFAAASGAAGAAPRALAEAALATRAAIGAGALGRGAAGAAPQALESYGESLSGSLLDRLNDYGAAYGNSLYQPLFR